MGEFTSIITVYKTDPRRRMDLKAENPGAYLSSNDFYIRSHRVPAGACDQEAAVGVGGFACGRGLMSECFYVSGFLPSSGA